MGSRQAYIKADMQKKLELGVLEGVAQIHETMNMVTDGFIDAIIKYKADGLNSDRLHNLVRTLLDSNREWANDMKTYIRIAGSYRKIFKRKQNHNCIIVQAEEQKESSEIN